MARPDNANIDICSIFRRDLRIVDSLGKQPSGLLAIPRQALVPCKEADLDCGATGVAIMATPNSQWLSNSAQIVSGYKSQAMLLRLVASNLLFAHGAWGGIPMVAGALNKLADNARA